MRKEEMIEQIAGFYGIESLDVDSYDWQAGCYLGVGGGFLNLESVLGLLECLDSDGWFVE